MNDLATVLRQSLPDEPPLGFGADDVVRRGRRARQRRTALVTGTACAVVAATALGALALRGPGATSGLVPTATDSPATPGETGGPLPDRVTLGGLTRVTSQVLDVKFGSRSEREGLEPGVFGGAEWFSVTGTVHDQRGTGTVTVAVMEPAALTYPATCASSALGDYHRPPGEYVGPCAVRTLADGSSLLERSGGVAGKEFTMTMAVLVRPDGSGVVSESTNLDHVGVWVQDGSPAPLPPPRVARAEPPVTSAQLARLVAELHPRTRYPE